MNVPHNIDVHINILSHLSTYKYLQLRELNHYFYNLVTNNPLPYPRACKLCYVNMHTISSLHKVNGLYFDIHPKEYCKTSSLTYIYDYPTTIRSLKVSNNIALDKLSTFTNLTYLQINDSKVTDNHINILIGLKKLVLCDDNPITNHGISTLTGLTFLSLNYKPGITDQSISLLTNLTYLDVIENDMITNMGISTLTNLNVLFANDNLNNFDTLSRLSNLYVFGQDNLNDVVQYEKLKILSLTVGSFTTNINRLTNITVLNFENQNRLSSEGFSCLTNLAILNLVRNNMIKNEDMYVMTQLRSLNLEYNVNITNIQHLTNLTELGLAGNEVISNKDIQLLTGLTYLDISNNKRITYEGIKYLTNIIHLDISRNILRFLSFNVRKMTQLKWLDAHDNMRITNNIIQNLTNLTTLAIYGAKKVTYDGIKNLVNLKKLSIDYHLLSRANINELILKCYRNTQRILQIKNIY